ncbi:hypothetical protein KP509_19G069300 [Ceratopteris richardii]|uniref:Uncharacterized protein n=1 Tax=Ceratopteris richardii TaxID=49495 RepID=A0A8T2SNC4_CERRI|nr:hypothetical protein KP509_19G069300 [Ceratopteris richardii]
MSLVAYSSDEDDGDEEEEEEKRERGKGKLKEDTLTQPGRAASPLMSSASMENPTTQETFHRSDTNTVVMPVKLPDASQLFASFNSGKGISAVNVSGASTKRSDQNICMGGPPRKIAKGNLVPSRTIPDTAGGALLPPQLRGSNVATEDLDRLFTKRVKPT